MYISLQITEMKMAGNRSRTTGWIIHLTIAPFNWVLCSKFTGMLLNRLSLPFVPIEVTEVVVGTVDS